MKSELEKIRKDRGLTTSFLANKFNITTRQFRRIELGETGLRNDRAMILAYIYRLPIDEVIRAHKRSAERTKSRKMRD